MPEKEQMRATKLVMMMMIFCRWPWCAIDTEQELSTV